MGLRWGGGLGGLLCPSFQSLRRTLPTPRHLLWQQADSRPAPTLTPMHLQGQLQRLPLRTFVDRLHNST